MIPLEQGSVFRQDMHKAPTVEKPASQSLWNRAVSFDLDLVKGKVSVEKSQSLWNRAVSFDGYRLGQIVALKSQSLWNRAVSFDQ